MGILLISEPDQYVPTRLARTSPGVTTHRNTTRFAGSQTILSRPLGLELAVVLLVRFRTPAAAPSVGEVLASQVCTGAEDASGNTIFPSVDIQNRNLRLLCAM